MTRRSGVAARPSWAITIAFALSLVAASALAIDLTAQYVGSAPIYLLRDRAGKTNVTVGSAGSTVRRAPLSTRISTPWTPVNALLESMDVFAVDLPDSITGECPPRTQPVYRLWNGRSDGNHRYTTDASVRQDMLARGFIAEGYGPQGVAMCSPLQ